jgi:hypothetical protein
MHVRFLNVSNLYLAYYLPEMKNKDLINLFNHPVLSHLFLLIFEVLSFLFLFLFIFN